MENKECAEANLKKVLVVDDEASIRKVVTRSLACAGYTIVEAADGQIAIDYLNQDLFDLVITDISMPILDGIELVRRIVRFYSADVIVMTGLVDEYRYDELIKLGAADFVQKPFTFDEITMRVNRLFRERRLQEEAIQLQRQASQSQKLESLGQITMGIAHEIKSPLQFAKDNIDFLKEGFEEMDAALSQLISVFDSAMAGTLTPEDLKKIHTQVDWEELAYSREEFPKALTQAGEGVQRIGEIITAIKGFSHPGRQEPSEASLIKCLQDAAVISKHEWKDAANICWDIEEGLPDVKCNPGELTQAFINLIINAAHAIQEKSGEDNTAGRGIISMEARRLGDHIEIRITDTGKGISEAVIPHIYDPFFTTKDVGIGTGQGLAITHSIVVDRHHGKIAFETREGKGTTFIISLPV